MRLLFFISVFFNFIFSSCNFEEKVLPPPQIFLDNEDGIFDMDRSDTLTIIPKITYDYESNHEWVYTKRKEIILKEKDLEFKDSTYGSYNFTFSVTNPTASDRVSVQINVYDIVNFEDFLFDEKKEYSKEGPFDFKYVQFPIKANSIEKTDWQGFAMSKVAKYPGKDKETSQYCPQSMNENDTSKIFSVYKHVDNVDLRILLTDNKASGHRIKSIDVNNTYEAYYRMYTENLFDRKKDTDYLKLVIHGYDAGGLKTNFIEHYLANYQFSEKEKEKRFVQSKWTTINLEELGPVNSLSFEILSSKELTDNNLSLSYFCLDNLKVMD